MTTTIDSTATSTQQPSIDLQECPVCHTIEDSGHMTGAIHEGRVAYFCVDCPLPDAA